MRRVKWEECQAIRNMHPGGGLVIVQALTCDDAGCLALRAIDDRERIHNNLNAALLAQRDSGANCTNAGKSAPNK